MDASFIIIIIIAVIGIYAISVYNRLITLKNNRENSFADIDVQLKQRYDVIPQLIETVKGYVKHEEKVLTEVTEARTRAVNANTIDEKIAAEAQMATALGGLNIAVEAYPELKADKNFLDVQEEISDIENKIAAARRYFNSATKEYNTAREMFPANIVANTFRFNEEAMFDLNDKREEAEKTPEIKF